MNPTLSPLATTASPFLETHIPNVAGLDPRWVMELSISVMKESVHEPRPDGAPTPSVGAVLYRPNHPIKTAARGELRNGNHAEFTLLERKCFGENVAGGIMAVTLEPCLCRNAPKLGCARHIVSARIKEVYIGVIDENPKVNGAGLRYLQDNGVTVHFYPPDLQDAIRRYNDKFLKWARAQKAS